MSSSRVAQRRDMQRDDVEPIVEVLAEPTGFDFPLQVLVGGGNDAYVDLNRARSTHAFEASAPE